MRVIGRQKKFKGSAVLALTVVTAVMLASIALSLVKLNSSATSTLFNNKTQVQAQQYALAEANLLRAIRYRELTDTAGGYMTNSGKLLDISGSKFSKKITIGPETNFSSASSIKQRIVEIEIFHNSDKTTPIIDLNIPCYDREKDYMPVGLIVGWIGDNSPSDVNGKWVECTTGKSVSSYPKVQDVSVNYNKKWAPDFKGTYLVCAEKVEDVGVQVTTPSLPNITGETALNYVRDGSMDSSTMPIGKFGGGFSLQLYSGAKGLKLFGTGEITTDNQIQINFDASKCSPVYNNDDDTVQLSRTNVRYFIKAE